MDSWYTSHRCTNDNNLSQKNSGVESGFHPAAHHMINSLISSSVVAAAWLVVAVASPQAFVAISTF